jgi:Ca2+-binding RTX toxin-like protein
MSSTSGKSYVGGTAGSNDASATNNPNGSYLETGGGNDTLRGGRYDDILDGGEGNDSMFGGGGADQFRFFGNNISMGQDTDRIFDLSFAEGDKLVLGNYGSGTFSDTAGVDGFNGGRDAIITSYEGIVNAANGSANVTAFRQGSGNDNLVFRVIDADGDIQDIVITGGYSQYIAAGGVEGA